MSAEADVTYDFTPGSPQFQQMLELWGLVKELAPLYGWPPRYSYRFGRLDTGTGRADKVLWAFNRGLLTRDEAQLLVAWLCTFQSEEFAQ